MGSAIAAKNVKLKRAYEPAEPSDGRRILVDRLWPRGVSKAEAALDEWTKELAPTTELRKWFGHDPAKWEDFRHRYAGEIHEHPDVLAHLRELAGQGPITLIYGARDEMHNDAVVLRDVILGREVH